MAFFLKRSLIRMSGLVLPEAFGSLRWIKQESGLHCLAMMNLLCYDHVIQCPSVSSNSICSYAKYLFSKEEAKAKLCDVC